MHRVRLRIKKENVQNTVSCTKAALKLSFTTFCRLISGSATWCQEIMAKKHQPVDHLCQIQGKLLIVEGNIAAGKSTFSKRLGEYFNYLVHDEPAPKNPYLAKFYREPKKYALKLQLWLFEQRYMMYLQGLKHILETGQGVILDRSVYSDLVFTNVIHGDGSISDDGYQYYLKLREKAMKNIQSPFAAIYLKVPPDVCFQRIVSRGRDYEQAIPLAYLDRLRHEHEAIFTNLSKKEACPVLTYDWSEFGRDPEHEEQKYSTSDMHFYSYGFNKVVADLEELQRTTTWEPVIAERLFNREITPDVLKSELAVEGFDHISHEIPEA